METYKITVPDYYTESDEILAYSPIDALVTWCVDTEYNSGFADGYPDGTIALVTDANGNVTRHKLVTDWSADYYVYDA